MSEPADHQLEAIAESIVFAHEAREPELPESSGTVLALEQTAALAAAAAAGSLSVPQQLQRHLAATGLAHCAEQSTRRSASPARPMAALASPPRLALLPSFLIGLAAGVALLFALQGRVPECSPQELRATMLTADARALQVPWQAGPSPLRGDLQGDVVWSQERQEGYLRFRGLPPLDAEHRFQLWIVDGSRVGDPVDGGLFVITDGSTEAIIPVKAHLAIGKPAAFVVTVERKDGVVVSKQEHVVAIAGL